MNTPALALATITITMVGVTLRGWRSGDALRDVRLMGVVTVLCAVGAGLAAWLT